MQQLNSTTIAACYALAAFAIAIISGLSSSSPASEILSNAILALMLCYFLGLIAAKIFQVILDEYQRTIEASAEPIAIEQQEPPIEHAQHAP